MIDLLLLFQKMLENHVNLNINDSKIVPFIWSSKLFNFRALGLVITLNGWSITTSLSLIVRENLSSTSVATILDIHQFNKRSI